MLVRADARGVSPRQPHGETAEVAGPPPRFLGVQRLHVTDVSLEFEDVRGNARPKSLRLTVPGNKPLYINKSSRAEIDRELERHGSTYGKSAEVERVDLLNSEKLHELRDNIAYLIAYGRRTSQRVILELPVRQRSDRQGSDGFMFYDIVRGSVANISIFFESYNGSVPRITETQIPTVRR